MSHNLNFRNDAPKSYKCLHPLLKSLIGVIASSTGIVPGWVFPGCGIWVYLTIQGFLYTTVSEISLYQNTMREPPDVHSGYTKVIKFEYRPKSYPVLSIDALLTHSGQSLLGHCQ